MVLSDDLPRLKDGLRQRLLSLRNDIDPPRRSRLDRRICAHLVGFFTENDFLNIAAFVPFRGEPDLMPALEVLHQAGRRIFLPVLDPERKAMDFRRWKPGADMKSNRFGIPEPASGADCPPAHLDLVLTPLVAFSPSGVRLGMGAGYYDRTFEFCREHPESGPMLVGLAYGLQEVDSLPAESWDVPLDGIVTEHGVRLLRRS